MSTLLPALVLGPLGAAVLVALLPAGASRAAGWLALLAAGGTTVAAAALVGQVGRDGPVRLPLGGWEPPLGIGLRADGLSATFVLLTAVVGLAVSVFASGSERARGSTLYWPLWLALWAGLNAVYLAADLFNAYVALEVVSVSAVALVTLGGRSALAPALRYLLVAVLGSLAYLLAVALVYAATGTLDMAQAGQALPAGTPAVAALVLTAVGMALKTALFPLHGWLPPAHSGAPAAVSPLLSALVVKASFYVLLRVWFDVLGAEAPAVAGVLGALGAVAVLWGAVLALRQDRLKPMVAYSTVAQVGYLFLLFPLAAPAAAEAAGSAAHAAAGLARDGVLAIAVAHGLAKAAMFMSAGALAQGAGSDRLADLRGAATRMPMAALAFAAAGVSLAGLPPTLAFLGKWQLLQAGLTSGQWWWVPVLLVGGLLTAGYTARALSAMLRTEDGADTGADTGDQAWPGGPERPVARRMQVAALVLALLTVVLGIRAAELFDLFEVGSTLRAGG